MLSDEVKGAYGLVSQNLVFFIQMMRNHPRNLALKIVINRQTVWIHDDIAIAKVRDPESASTWTLESASTSWDLLLGTCLKLAASSHFN